MIDYSLILSTNYSNKAWTLVGNSYDGLEWRDESQKPTQTELDALWTVTQSTYQQKEQATKDAKVSALAKLAALGLTQDEVKALVG